MCHIDSGLWSLLKKRVYNLDNDKTVQIPIGYVGTDRSPHKLAIAGSVL